MALSRYAPYVVSDNNMMVEYFIRGLRVELHDAIVPLMCKTMEEAAQRAATLERSIRTRQAGESGSGSFRLPQQTVGASKGKTPAGPSTSGFGKWGQKLKQAFKGKGRGWGGRLQFQQGRGRPEVEESQQSTARQPVTPPGYRCYNCNQPGHLIRNCPYAREYGYGRAAAASAVSAATVRSWQRSTTAVRKRPGYGYHPSPGGGIKSDRSCLTFSRGAAAGPFVRGCETER
ncbi:hypothetical protein Taro_040716 [Colocasia esculenta]|uniref:CCHC-type domain-containing protein n=1 Tax=Colocasia esculenta TaxID=4460 RepID=A0A843WDW6_COLES|nr:hypothetical protein [Colocasia esculenta]